MPSVASEVNAAQQSRIHHSQARSRTDGNDRSQSSPFADMLDSAAPAADPAPAPQPSRADKADRNDDSRPADKNRKSDAASDRDSAKDTKSASDTSDAADAKDAKSASADATAKDAKASAGDAKTNAKTDGDTAAADADAKAKTDGDLAAALQALADPTQQQAAANPNAVAAPQPVVTDAAAAQAGADAGKAPQIDALAALQAAEQTAAAANAGASDTAEATAGDDAKGKGDDVKGDGTVKKDAKADAKGDTKALTQAQTDAIADGKTAAAQPQSDSDDAGQQDGSKPAAPSHPGVAKPAVDAAEPETRGHRATQAEDAAKTGAVQAQNAQAAATAASADVAASTAAAATSATSNTQSQQPQALTSAHLQAQLQASADTSSAVPVNALPVEIATRVVAGKRQFEIRLDPPELGRVDVKVDIDNNGNTTTRLVVEKAETLDLLKRDSQQLERALQQAGLKTSDNGLEFSLRQQTAQNDDQGTSGGKTIAVPDEDAAPLPVQRQGYGRLLGMSGGLDIRV